MNATNTKNALPKISPSSQLRKKTETVTGPFQFNFDLHRPSGALLFLPESDHGFIEAVRGAEHREPESHIEESADRIMDSITTLGHDFKEMKIYGLSDKDLTLLSSLESRTGQNSSSLFPGLHCLEVENRFLESLSDLSLIDADLVVARHIIEHLRDIDTFLAGLRDILKPGAFCFIEVPDSTRLFTRGDISQLWEEHTVYFTPLTVRNLVESWAFEVVYEETRVSDGEDLCLILIQASGGEAAHRVSSTTEREKDFLNKLPEFLNNLSSKLLKRSVDNHLWIYGANHISGLFLDLVVDRKSPVQGVIDDDPLKKHLHMSKMDVEVFPYDVLPRGKSADVLVAVAEGRAPNLYNKLRHDFPQSSGHRVQSLVSFCEECWEEGTK